MNMRVLAYLSLMTLAGAVQHLAADSVAVAPEGPTSADSLTFTLFLDGHCCCTQFHARSVMAADTAIQLYFEPDDSLCSLCQCAMAGSTAAFQSGPLAPGRYGVYKIEGHYCRVGMPCPDIISVPVRVGEITVAAPAASEAYTRQGMNALEINPNPVNGMAWIRLSATFRNQFSGVKIFDLCGALVADLSESLAGREVIKWDASGVPPGIYLVKADMAGRSLSRRILVR